MLFVGETAALSRDLQWFVGDVAAAVPFDSFQALPNSESSAVIPALPA
jgi:hypothetical protein